MEKEGYFNKELERLDIHIGKNKIKQNLDSRIIKKYFKLIMAHRPEGKTKNYKDSRRKYMRKCTRVIFMILRLRFPKWVAANN